MVRQGLSSQILSFSFLSSFLLKVIGSVCVPLHKADLIKPPTFLWKNLVSPYIPVFSWLHWYLMEVRERRVRRWFTDRNIPVLLSGSGHWCPTHQMIKNEMVSKRRCLRFMVHWVKAWSNGGGCMRIQCVVTMVSQRQKCRFNKFSLGIGSKARFISKTWATRTLGK